MVGLLGLLTSCATQTEIGVSNPDCDPLMEARCGFPWPSNLYLVSDSARKTGYTLTFGPTTLPQNEDGVHVDPTALKRLDGYSVGTPILTLFPNIDVSGLPREDQIDRSLAADAPILLFEAGDTGARRVPCFAELDLHETDPTKQALIVRPAEILKEATRYVVAFRGLRDRSGAAVPRGAAFQLLLDGKTQDIAALKGRQARFDATFQFLEAQGVGRDQLTLAWDFHTASSDAYHSDLLRVRDAALKDIGTTGATLRVKSVKELTPQQDSNIALEILGEVDLPLFLADQAFAKFKGSKLNRDPSGKPLRSGTYTLPFWLMVPQAALNGPAQGMVLYGHGLLGEGNQTFSSFNRRIANQNNLIFFGTNLTGMTSLDFPSVAGILADLSAFSSLADRLQQGIVDWVVLARTMRIQLGGLPELMARKVTVDPKQLFYSGISQGGIFGATFMAVSPDVTYGHLGVPGNNYSLLLQRSRDFNKYLDLMRLSYPDPTDRLLLLSVMQLLWDFTDPVTHLRHITAQPHPGSNGPHYVLLAPARGDQQVSVLSNEILARTSDVQIPLLANYDVERRPALATPAEYPRTGSGVVLWNFGQPWPQLGNFPPDTTIPGAKACTQDADCPALQECDTDSTKRCVLRDPHESPRRNDEHNRQMVNFFRTGKIIDVCNNAPCKP